MKGLPAQAEPDLGAASLFDLTGQTALVTGAGGTIGRLAAQALLANGARVFVSDLAPQGVASVCEELRRRLAGGDRVGGTSADLAVEGEAERLCAAAAEAFAVPDIVIHAAGIGHRAAAMETGLDEWRRLTSVNVEASFTIAREAARGMVVAGKPGSIVLVGSFLARRTLRNTAAYAAGKAAIAQMTRSLALEWARHKIRVNEIVPGWFASAMTEPFLGGRAGEVMAQTNPMRRLGRPCDLAGAVLLLSSGAGAYMTGASLCVDGGQALA